MDPYMGMEELTRLRVLHTKYYVDKDIKRWFIVDQYN